MCIKIYISDIYDAYPSGEDDVPDEDKLPNLPETTNMPEPSIEDDIDWNQSFG